MIPKVLHKIWIGSNKPNFDFTESWKLTMPTYRITYWHDDNIESEFGNDKTYSYLKQHYGPTMISDYVRLCILKKYGGVYADLDVMFFKDIQPFLSTPAFCTYQFPHIPEDKKLKKTPTGLSLRDCVKNFVNVYNFYNTDIYLCNNLIGSEPGGKFINAMLDAFVEQLDLPIDKRFSYVDYGNGPMLTTHVARKFCEVNGYTEHSDTVSIYESSVFHPTNYVQYKDANVKRKLADTLTEQISIAKQVNSYAMHMQGSAEVDTYLER
jgi:mannosyltransferase OCH1-like enzyme